jgi:excisionase family DNA binding protein
MATHTQEVDSQPASPMRVAASASPMRFGIPEAAELLRMSRAQLYNRISDGAIKPHKDGGRTYISRCELERYVDSFR